MSIQAGCIINGNTSNIGETKRSEKLSFVIKKRLPGFTIAILLFALNLNAMTEKTLIILKPDCMEKNLGGQVLARFTTAGFEMVACKMMHLDEDLLRQHYDFLVQQPFFPEIVRFMTSRPVIVCVLKGENAIARIRELLGPTDSTLAPKGTIRGDMGKDKSQNIAHASDSPASAQKEIQRFFKPEEVFG